MSLPRATPESQGFSSSMIERFIAEAAQHGPEQQLHSLMVLRHGHVIFEAAWSPYSLRAPHLLYSLSKSFTSTAAGLLIHEGRMSLDDRIVDLFPDRLPETVSENLGALKIRHLLSMSAGQTSEPWANLDRASSKDWITGFLKHPIVNVPGEKFLYNSIATFMVAAAIERITGEPLDAYLKPRLFDPLGITEYTWDKNPEGIVVGGWGLSLVTESVAKFGQLYLQKGEWEGKQIVPREWVEQATSKQVSNGSDPENDWQAGYGYQFWRCANGNYRGDGAFGQFCVVSEKLDMVVVTTACVDAMQETLDLIHQTLLSAEGLMSASSAAVSLPSSYQLQAWETESVPQDQPKRLTFRLRHADWLRAEITDSIDRISVKLVSDTETFEFTGGLGEWTIGETKFENERGQQIAVSAHRSAHNVIEIFIAYLAEPANTRLTFEWTGGEGSMKVIRRGRFVPDPLQTFNAEVVEV